MVKKKAKIPKRKSNCCCDLLVKKKRTKRKAKRISNFKIRGPTSEITRMINSIPEIRGTIKVLIQEQNGLEKEKQEIKKALEDAKISRSNALRILASIHHQMTDSKAQLDKIMMDINRRVSKVEKVQEKAVTPRRSRSRTPIRYRRQSRSGSPVPIAAAGASPDSDVDLEVLSPHGRGRGKKVKDKGLSDVEINNMMKPYGSRYLGTIAHNEIPKIVKKIKPKTDGGFVINTDPASKGGEHWQAVYFDARPGGNGEINFYDSYGDPIDKTLQRDLELISKKLKAGTYLKFKENRIRQQDGKSSNCGWFSAKFLMDRFRGVHWKDASGYNDSSASEKKIKHFKEGYGYMSSF